MIKTINVSFEQKDFIELLKIKGEQPWDKFILSLLEKEGEKNANIKSK